MPEPFKFLCMTSLHLLRGSAPDLIAGRAAVAVVVVPFPLLDDKLTCIINCLMWSWSHNFHHQNQYFVAKAHWYLYPTFVTTHLSRTGDSLCEPPDLSLFCVALNTRRHWWHWRFCLCRELNLATNLISGRFDKYSRSFRTKNFLHAWSSGVHGLHCDSHSCGLVEPIWWFIPSL